MFDTLDRYLTRDFLAYFFLILIGLASLFLGIDFLSNFWRSGDPIEKVLTVYGYRTPQVLQMFLPVACLMATLLVLTNMSRQNEILALMTSGTSPLRILSSFIALVATLSTLAFLIFDPLIPVMKRKQILLERGIDPRSGQHLEAFERSDFWFRSGSMVYNVGHANAKTKTLRDVRLYSFGPGLRLTERMEAKEARYEDGKWNLYDGVLIRYPSQNGFPQHSTFSVSPAPIAEAPSDFKAYEVVDEALRLKELREHIEKNRSYGLDTTQEQVKYHERIALVFSPLVFLLLGFPFAVRPLKSSSGSHGAAQSVGLTFLIVFAYLLMTRLTITVGKVGHLPPMIAAWAPNALFSSLAALRIFSR